MTGQTQFTVFSRLLHWLMAVLVLAMLFIGVGMVSSVSERYALLVSIHKPIGIAILILVAIRLVNRLLNPPPPARARQGIMLVNTPSRWISPCSRAAPRWARKVAKRKYAR